MRKYLSSFHRVFILRDYQVMTFSFYPKISKLGNYTVHFHSIQYKQMNTLEYDEFLSSYPTHFSLFG